MPHEREGEGESERDGDRREEREKMKTVPLCFLHHLSLDHTWLLNQSPLL